MPEKFLSQDEKKETRAENDAKLLRDGALFISDEKQRIPHLELTAEQIEQAHKEMGEYFAATEKAKEDEQRAAIEIEKRLKDLVQAAMDEDRQAINKNVADLIVMLSPTEDLLDPGFRWSFDLKGMLGRLTSWMDDSKIPIVGWDDKDDQPKLLRMRDVLSDDTHELASTVHTILKQMSNSNSCLQVLFSRDGKVHCPNCERSDKSR